ncbi:MAG: hypothetical protein DRP65_09535 [Planctomycetota bacterium]|nr:MAG: hypothetical protein DRP65_09535 [Planctomycetota bacterium]
MGITNPYGPVNPKADPEPKTRDELIAHLQSGGYTPGHLPRGMGMIQDTETGEMKFFGSPIEAAAPPEVSIDPNEILAKQMQDNLAKLESDVATITAEITEKPRYALEQLALEHEIKDRYLKEKFLKTGASDEERQAYRDAFEELNKQTELAKLRIESKVQPDLDKIRAQKQQMAAQIQRDFEDRQLEIRRIDALQEKGVIKDPAVADRERFEIAGIKFSTADLRPPQADPYREMRRIDTLIQGLDEQIEELAKPFILGETDAEAAARKTDMQALVQQRNMLKDYKEKQLLPQIFPQFAEMFRRTGRIRSATTPVLPATGEPVGTVGTVVKKELEKSQGGARRQLDTATAQMLLQEAGGDKDKARQLAKSRGYKL